MKGESNDVWFLSHDDPKPKKTGVTLNEAMGEAERDSTFR